MLPRDKYTIFDKKEKTYRKGIHSKLPLPDSPVVSTLFQYLVVLDFTFWTAILRKLFGLYLVSNVLFYQNYQNGPVSANVSTLQVSKRLPVPWSSESL
jgi:hypothetical protein